MRNTSNESVRSCANGRRRTRREKLAITLDHQYTKDGIAWDTLKGVDRVKAQVLLEAARQAGCRAYLALLTSRNRARRRTTGGYGYGRPGPLVRRRR